MFLLSSKVSCSRLGEFQRKTISGSKSLYRHQPPSVRVVRLLNVGHHCKFCSISSRTSPRRQHARLHQLACVQEGDGAGEDVAGEGVNPARRAGNALRDHPRVAGSLRHGVGSQGHSVEQVVFRQAVAVPVSCLRTEQKQPAPGLVYLPC